MTARILRSIAPLLAPSLGHARPGRGSPATQRLPRPGPRRPSAPTSSSRSDTITLGDLVTNAGAAAIGAAVFRAPALGRSGTIQVPRVLEAAIGAGITGIDAGRRFADRGDARRPADRQGRDRGGRLAPRSARYGMDQAEVSIALRQRRRAAVRGAGREGRDHDRSISPTMPRSLRLEAVVAVAGSRSLALKPPAITGTVVGQRRGRRCCCATSQRGETVRISDIRMERRPRRDAVDRRSPTPRPSSARSRGSQLQAGAVLRDADLAKQELVEKNGASSPSSTRSRASRSAMRGQGARRRRDRRRRARPEHPVQAQSPGDRDRPGTRDRDRRPAGPPSPPPAPPSPPSEQAVRHVERILNVQTPRRVLAAHRRRGLGDRSPRGACGTADRLANVGKAPTLSAIEDPTAQPGYKPVQMPMPTPEPVSYAPNSLWRQGSRAFFKDQRARQIGDLVTVRVKVTDKAQHRQRHQALAARTPRTSAPSSCSAARPRSTRPARRHRAPTAARRQVRLRQRRARAR